MPYIIETRYSDCATLPSPCPACIDCVIARTAVATEHEARSAVRDLAVRSGIAHGTTADPFALTGGTVGPLPDGTTIEVRRVAFDIWHDDEGVWGTQLGAIMGVLIGPHATEREAEDAILAAFNARLTHRKYRRACAHGSARGTGIPQHHHKEHHNTARTNDPRGDERTASPTRNSHADSGAAYARAGAPRREGRARFQAPPCQRGAPAMVNPYWWAYGRGYAVGCWLSKLLFGVDPRRERLVRCANCGFKFGAHDEVDGRCPNPDGML